MIENIRISLRGIFHHKMRSFLTMLGVIIGIASILAIVSVVQGTRMKLEKSLIGDGNNVVHIEPYQDDMPAYYNYNSPDAIPLGFPAVTSADRKAMASLPHVKAASAYRVAQTGMLQVCYQDQQLGNANVYGVDETYFRTTGCRLLAGKAFSKKDAEGAKKICVMNQRSAEKLFGSAEAAIGQAIEIGKEPYVITGVVDTSSKDSEEYESEEDYYNRLYSGGSGGDCVFLPLGCWPLVGYYDEPECVAALADETKNMQSVGNDVSDYLNARVTDATTSYKASNSDASADSLKTLTNAITVMLVSIASLSLLVGGIGVMNIMLVSVSERTAEIGLKKALGAKPRTIRAQFLTESAVLTSVGGILGVLIGLLLGRIIALFLTLDFAISVPWILIAVGFSVGVGLLFGFLPARKAAKMNPIDALHRE